MRIINITASNLAKLTGHNKYESIEKTIQTILNSNKIKGFDIPKTNIEEGVKKLLHFNYHFIMSFCNSNKIFNTTYFLQRHT